MTGSPPAAAFRTALERRVGIDIRGLAAFRIGVGLLLLADLLLRARDLTAFYTDDGVLPRVALADAYPLLSRLSIHALSGDGRLQAALFVAAGVAAVSLAVGYRTRLSATVSWVLLASLDVRNPFVLNGGDNLLLLALFVGLFLPLGTRWSVDAVRRSAEATRGPPPDRIVGFASAAILTQVVLLYLTNGVFKLRGDAWTHGVAVRYVFELDRFTILFGEYLAQAPLVLATVNWLWIALLVCSPLLLAATPRVRLAVVGAFVASHVGMLLTIGLGLFPFVTICCLVLFVPSSAWERVERHTRPYEHRLAASVEAVGPYTERPNAPSMRWVRRTVGRATPVVTATILVVGLLWQAAAVGAVETQSVPVVDAQPDGWKLFAPGPPRARGWYVVDGELESGERVDLYPHGNTSRAPPPDAGASYPNRRWRKYLTRVRQHTDVLAPAFARYLCSTGAARYDEPVEELSIEYVREPVRFDGAGERTVVELGTYSCRAGS